MLYNNNIIFPEFHSMSLCAPWVDTIFHPQDIPLIYEPWYHQIKYSGVLVKGPGYFFDFFTEKNSSLE